MTLSRVACLRLGLLAFTVLNCDPQSSSVPTTTGAREFERAATVTAAGAPVGDFQTQPTADAERVITVSLGDPVTISGGRFTASNVDDELKLEVEWGDGERSTNGCGPCRVDHVYRAGVYHLTATIHDRRFVDRGSVTQAFTVVMVGPAAPTPAPTPVPVPCHSIGTANGVACPTGATQFCVAGSIDANNSAHARAACEACYGIGGCVASGVGCGPFTVLSWLDNGFNSFYVYRLTSGSGVVPGDIFRGSTACLNGAVGRWAP